MRNPNELHVSVVFSVSVCVSSHTPSLCAGRAFIAFNANGGDLSSAPSCGEKQYSSDLIDIPCIEVAANMALEF